MNTWQVILLGLLEGLTEFIPVSSTGHLLLAGHFLGFNSPGKTFEVLIQLGSILAIVSVYFTKLLRLLIDLPSDARTRRFVLAVLVAFLPAAVIGAVAHKYIKEYLFESPMLVCTTLIVGGIVLLAVDKMRLEPRYHDAMDLPIPTALGDRPLPVPGHDAGRVALGLQHRRRAAARGGQALGDGVLVLPRHADHGRRLRLRPLQELRPPDVRRMSRASRSVSWWRSSPASWSCAIS